MSDCTYLLLFSNDRFMKGIIMMLKKENGRSNALAAYVTFLLIRNIWTYSIPKKTKSYWIKFAAV